MILEPISTSLPLLPEPRGRMLVVPSILDAVTVHAEGALCTRIATLQLVEDRVPTEIQLNGLPLSLRPGTLRAAIRQGPPGLVVRAIRPPFDVQLPPEVDVPGEHRALEEDRKSTRLNSSHANISYAV